MWIVQCPIHDVFFDFHDAVHRFQFPVNIIYVAVSKTEIRLFQQFQTRQCVTIHEIIQIHIIYTCNIKYIHIYMVTVYIYIYTHTYIYSIPIHSTCMRCLSCALQELLQLATQGPQCASWQHREFHRTSEWIDASCLTLLLVQNTMRMMYLYDTYTRSFLLSPILNGLIVCFKRKKGRWSWPLTPGCCRAWWDVKKAMLFVVCSAPWYGCGSKWKTINGTTDVNV